MSCKESIEVISKMKEWYMSNKRIPAPYTKFQFDRALTTALKVLNKQAGILKKQEETNEIS